MKQALINMLSMQDRMNTRVHENWAAQNFEWYRAIWVECGELIDHYGYKWWKKQDPEMEQVQLEVIDIWHFGMSALFRDGVSIEQMAENIEAEIKAFSHSGLGVRDATEALAQHSLESKGFSPTKTTLPSGHSAGSLSRITVAADCNDFLKYFLTSEKVISPGSTLWISLMPVATSLASPII